MKLSRTQPNFNDYVVLRRQRWWEWLWSIVTLTIVPRYAGYELLDNVLEADDSTGLVVRQQVDGDGGEPLYINAAGDTVVIDNTLRVLLLVPDIRVHFLREFLPKTEQTFVKGLTIMRVNVTEAQRLPQVQDGEETFIMKGGYDG